MFRKYFRKERIVRESTTSEGLTELIFADSSRYVGLYIDESPQGRGTFYFQDGGRFQGAFHSCRALNGLLTLFNAIELEGEFNDEEQLRKGVIRFLGIGFEVKVVMGVRGLARASFKGETGLEDLDLGSNRRELAFAVAAGYTLLISEDNTRLTLQKTYGGGFFDSQRCVVDLRARDFEVERWVSGLRDGRQTRANFRHRPFLSVVTYVRGEGRLWEARNVSGASFRSDSGFSLGLFSCPEEGFEWRGACVEGTRDGRGIAHFDDGCELPVEFSRDRPVFSDLASAFDLVASFSCAGHPKLGGAGNAMAARLLGSAKEFRGHLIGGDSQGPVTLVLADETKFVGPLRALRFHGPGELTTAEGRFEGEFVDGELPYGRVAYTNRAAYEGPLLGLRRHGSGFLRFANGWVYRGEFKRNRFSGTGTLVAPDDTKTKVRASDLAEFDLAVFLAELGGDLYLADCITLILHGASFVDKLKSSGIDLASSPSFREILGNPQPPAVISLRGVPNDSSKPDSTKVISMRKVQNGSETQEIINEAETDETPKDIPNGSEAPGVLSLRGVQKETPDGSEFPGLVSLGGVGGGESPSFGSEKVGVLGSKKKLSPEEGAKIFEASVSDQEEPN